MIRLFIVDDHYMVVEGVRTILQHEDSIEWMGHASSAAACMAFVHHQEPDVILMDINLPDQSGIELCSAVKALRTAVKIIALSTFNQHSYITKMMEAGADGYLLKNAAKEEIMEALHTVMRHQQYLSFEAATAIRRQDAPDVPLLTRREKEVLALIAEGLTNAEIAAQLFISLSTVDSHRKHLLEKLQAKNTAALVRIAIGYKLINL